MQRHGVAPTKKAPVPKFLRTSSRIRIIRDHRATAPTASTAARRSIDGSGAVQHELPSKPLVQVDNEEAVLKECERRFNNEWRTFEPKFHQLAARHGVAVVGRSAKLERRCIAHITLVNEFVIATVDFHSAMQRAVDKTLSELDGFLVYLKSISYAMSGLTLLFWNGIKYRHRGMRGDPVRAHIYLLVYVEGERPADC